MPRRALARAPATRHDHRIMSSTSRPVDRRLTLLLIITAACYAIGYPLALIGHSAVGWGFVALGGPFLIAVGVIVIARVHRGNAGGDDQQA